MESKGNRWFVKKDHYLNMDEYNVCMQAADDRIPTVCIGSFQGIEELRKFGSTLRGHLVEGGKLSADIRDAYRQITRAIDAEVAACG